MKLAIRLESVFHSLFCLSNFFFGSFCCTSAFHFIINFRKNTLPTTIIGNNFLCFNFSILISKLTLSVNQMLDQLLFEIMVILLRPVYAGYETSKKSFQNFHRSFWDIFLERDDRNMVYVIVIPSRMKKSYAQSNK